MITETSTITFNDDSSQVNIDDYTFNLNDTGDAIDSEGNVIATADSLSGYRKDTGKPVDLNNPTPDGDNEPDADDDTKLTEINIDGVTHQIDESGNAVNADGVIIMTAAEIEQELAKDNVEGLADVIKTTGIPIFDEDGSKIEYEDSVEGLQAYIKDVAEVYKEEGREEAIAELFNTYPVLEDVVNHLKSNKSLDTFNQSIDYKEIELSKDDEDTIKDIIIHAKMLKGETFEEAEAVYEYLKTKGTSFETATKLRNDLIANQASEREEYRRSQLEEQRAEQEAHEQYLSTINQRIDNGTINVNGSDLVIPSKFAIKENGSVNIYSREEFKVYFTEPLDVRFKDGSIRQMTGYEFDKMNEDNKRTVDHDILDALRLFTNDDLSQVINKQVDHKKVKDIKTLIRRSTDGTLVTKPNKVEGGGKITYRLPGE